MRNVRMVAIAILLFSTSALTALAQAPAGGPPANRPPPMSLTSTSFADGSILNDKYTSASPNPPISPALAWDRPPPGTVSYVLILHDPDNAQRGHYVDTLHWLMFNIPATTHSLPEGVPATPTLPDGSIQIKTPRVVGFMGPGARGDVYHHYTFELLALDTKLDLGPDATRDDVMKALDGHILGKAVDEFRHHLPVAS